ncbi:Csu type fimbrial protein [Montanilutibacter psychrotolerans]|uniref:Spore coat U domain-containing protein n=1 Tax=Montanilutibacter psychrotolerans TaxID=1327343 RepID=A0A3M8SVR5_9GAMM|nr:spore coat U domain-containing protein [Lysobacter psychrotolerans]RNF84913.1 spore coat U domain-containing protein [Lysobacter psychrotolerans]
MTRIQSLLSTVLLATAALYVPAAHAQTATTTFDVTITIQSSCTVNTPAATDVAFGTHPSTDTNIDAAGQLNVNCTPGTDYTISLDEGLNAGGGGVAARAMINGGTDLVPYQLYTDSGRTDIWGETIGTDTVAGTGTGAVQAYQVYGRVPSAGFPADSYSDTVTATVTY